MTEVSQPDRDPEGPERSDPAGETHRGAFGEYGGESEAFIERTFRERVLLVGVDLPPHDHGSVEASLDELSLLVQTAGADEVARVTQRREAPDPATFLGRGKVAEIRELAEAADCDTVVFDDELSPAQQNNLTRSLGRSAIDRTAVILDIFAQNAHSQEGKAQVQLALYRYRLPRLRGKGLELSQQAGGIGARRGPGETQFEIDRRRIQRQIHKLESDLERIGRHRDNQRKARRRSRMPHVVVVGYTNAGKSTLLNRLTDAGVLVEDRLFATLDATTRRLSLPGGEAVLVTDTVGFVRKLPHQLVEAFRTTLEVVTEADLLLHVVDGSADDPGAQMQAVRSVLGEIGGAEVPELVVFNKSDRSPEPARLAVATPGAVAISARTGDGIEELLARIGDRLRAHMGTAVLDVPYARGDVLAAVHRSAEVLTEEPGSDAMRVTARMGDEDIRRFAAFAVDGADDGPPEQ